MKKNDFEENDIEEINEFEEIDSNGTYAENESDEVEELTDEEIEETAGGAYALKSLSAATNMLSGSSGNIGSLKSYGKHCGGIELIIKTPTVSIPKVGARIGTIDKIYITKSSIPASVSGVGTSNLVVTRKSGKLGLVTLEIHGHQQGEPKNWRFVVVRVNFL